MSFVVYILYSSMLDQYYIGHTANVEDRLFRHTNSGSKSTKKTDDWKLVYTETFPTKSEAGKRELTIKNKKSRKYIEWLIIQKGWSVPQYCGKVTGSTPVISTSPDNVKFLNSCPVFCWLKPLLVVSISRTASLTLGVRLFSLEKEKFSGKIKYNTFV